MAPALTQQEDRQHSLDVTVMTYNLYLGADLTPVLLAPTPEAFKAAVTAVLAQVAATNFEARAKAIAAHIRRVQPDLVGFQEAVLWQHGASAATASSGRNGETVDFLEILLDALNQDGPAYRAVSVAQGADIASRETQGPDVRFTNRNVIVARADLPPANLRVRQIEAAAFESHLTIPSPQLGAVPITRGWTSAIVELYGRPFCFVTAHLEDSHPVVQAQQAVELMQALAHEELPVILVGDFNAEPTSLTIPTYAAMLEAGFRDAWREAGNAAPGYTCCQESGLHNAESALSARIDWVLVRGAVEVRAAQLVGDDAQWRTPEGLWPSDHAGVAATLRLL